MKRLSDIVDLQSSGAKFMTSAQKDALVAKKVHFALKGVRYMPTSQYNHPEWRMNVEVLAGQGGDYVFSMPANDNRDAIMASLSQHFDGPGAETLGPCILVERTSKGGKKYLALAEVDDDGAETLMQAAKAPAPAPEPEDPFGPDAPEDMPF